MIYCMKNIVINIVTMIATTTVLIIIIILKYVEVFFSFHCLILDSRTKFCEVLKNRKYFFNYEENNNIIPKHLDRKYFELCIDSPNRTLHLHRQAFNHCYGLHQV